MSMQQIVPSAPVAPVVPSWALYVYDQIGYLTYSGRLIAFASCATPAQDAHIERLFARLTTTHTTAH